MSDIFWLTIGQLFTQDRSHARRHRSLKSRLARLTLFCLLLAGAYAAFTAQRSGALSVQDVQVTGAQAVKVQDVVARTDLIGKSVFNIDAAAASASVESIPYVASAEVKPGLLSTTVRVVVTERAPAIRVLAGGRYYLADNTGVVLEETQGGPHVPVLELKDRRPLQPGEKLDGRQVAFALTLYGELASSIRPVVDRITYTAAGGYEIVSSAGWQAVIGDDTQVGVKAEVLRQVLLRRGVQYVDVSSPSVPYYRATSPKPTGGART